MLIDILRRFLACSPSSCPSSFGRSGSVIPVNERFPPLDDAASETALVSGGSVRSRTIQPKSLLPGVPLSNSSPLINLCRRLVAMVSLTGGVFGEAFGFGELPWDVEEPELLT